jgi:hypothetical protein
MRLGESENPMRNFDFHRLPAKFLTMLKETLGPKWLALFMIFTILYVPFLYHYGWAYRDIPNRDLPSFYAASVSVFNLGESPYDPARLETLMEGDEYVFPYLYPPPSLLFFLPLSVLTYADARQVALILNHLSFLFLVWAIPLYLLRKQPRFGFTEAAICIVYSLTFYPAALTLEHGQVNILLAVFLFLFWILAEKGKSLSSSFFLALAVLLKTYPIIIIPLLLLTRRWREALYTLGWLVLATLISFAVLPNAVWHDWLTKVLPVGGYMQTAEGMYPPAAIWNQSLNGFFARMFTESDWSNPFWVNPTLARSLTYLAAGVVSAFTALATWRSRTHADSSDRMMIPALLAMYLIAPFSWEHHLVYLLPPVLILLLRHASFETLPKAAFYSLGIASALLLGLPFALEYKFYSALALWGLSIFSAVSEIEKQPVQE